jgi:hypothetical protein
VFPEKCEDLAPTVHGLLGPIKRTVPIENAVTGAVVAVELVIFAVRLECGLVLVDLSGLGARSSLPKIPISGHERSFVI